MPGDIPLGLGLFEGFAFVVVLLAAADAHQHLGQAALEVHLERHERQALAETPWRRNA